MMTTAPVQPRGPYGMPCDLTIDEMRKWHTAYSGGSRLPQACEGERQYQRWRRRVQAGKSEQEALTG